MKSSVTWSNFENDLRFPPELQVLGDTVAGPPEGQSDGDSQDGQAETVHARDFTKSESFLLLTVHPEMLCDQCVFFGVSYKTEIIHYFLGFPKVD